ncbi:IPT/TIG domain-containing protein [Streptantibioticus ferralitis]|uniref:IPT/TIG domain-containing protein n=1 Tax=Streptantibioticus ferralitis TaxID=236510 RepID=A0ABT5YVA0_9ACTN|nr:IPT/TIG domain-containing protein [Streptantibioticus ferralitis]MDF2254745.1 IPT/TIG domain-containing protein [Streptantibioticus ferralitis]
MTAPAPQVSAPGLGLPGLTLPWPFGPVLVADAPNFGPAAGGNLVTLVGLGLNGATQVLFGTSHATIVGGDFLGFTLQVIAPPGTGTGTVQVTVTTPSGTSNTVPYTYIGAPPPTATSITPASGPTTGSTPFVISGTNLTGGTVTFGGTSATVLSISPTQIIGLTPAHATGNVPVVVTTAGGSVTVLGGFTYLPAAPVVTVTVQPTTSLAAGGGTFTIVGTNLTGATVTFGTTTATITANTDTLITGTIPAGTASTTVNVTVTTPGGTASAGTLTYLPAAPVVTVTVQPTTSLAAGGGTFTIVGTNLTGATVTFGTTTATITANTDTLITGTIPAGTASTTVNVTVTTPGGTTSAGTLTYLPAAPVVTVTVQPTTSLAAGGGTFTIAGTNLTGATVTFGTTTATITSNTGTLITGTIPAGTASTTVNVTVTTPGGTASAGTLTYLSAAPVVTVTIQPVSGPSVGGTPFTIGGTNLAGATVTFGTATANITSNTGILITGTTPAGTASTTVNVVVTTPGGTASGGAYTYIGA